MAFFQVLDASQASYEITNLQIAILNLTMTNIRTVMGSMDLDKLLSERDEINHRLLKVVDDATHNWGVKVTRIEIKDIEPPRDLIDSMARQMKAERDKRAAILVAEGERQAAILTAEGSKQAQILAAEGRREAAYRDAEARERSAEAEAKATQVVSEAIGKGSVQAINYFVANNYIGALKALAEAKNQKVLILPIEASSVIGAIAGVGEIAREAFGGGGDASASAAPKPQPPRVPASAAQSQPSNRRKRRSWKPSSQLGAWSWMIVAAILFVLELAAPGIFLMWFGLAAAVTGLTRVPLRVSAGNGS